MEKHKRRTESLPWFSRCSLFPGSIVLCGTKGCPIYEVLEPWHGLSPQSAWKAPLETDAAQGCAPRGGPILSCSGSTTCQPWLRLQQASGTCALGHCRTACVWFGAHPLPTSQFDFICLWSVSFLHETADDDLVGHLIGLSFAIA